MNHRSKHALTKELPSSLVDILQMFHLPVGESLTSDQMKAAKRMVLQMHPDKSRLAPEYFIYYKRAFEVVVDYYHEQLKTTQDVCDVAATEYSPQVRHVDVVPEAAQSIQKMDGKTFQKTFNALFEETMVDKTAAASAAASRHAWFKAQDAEPQWQAAQQRATSVSDMNRKLTALKEQQKATLLATYRGVQPIQWGGYGTNTLYDDDDDANGGEGVYLASDPFSKLCYDDLRKVHRDQTVIAVSEQDYRADLRAASIKAMEHERSRHIAPVGTQAELDAAERARQQRIQEKAYAAKLASLQYEEKNKAVLSHFLRLT